MNLTDPDTVLNGMMIFYLIIAIVGLMFAIILYPTLRQRSKKS